MTTSAATKPDPDAIFRQWIFQRFDGADWRDAKVRQAVYAHMSDAIDRMPVETFGEGVTDAYRTALSRITERLEAHVGTSASLEDLGKSLDGGREIVPDGSARPVEAAFDPISIETPGTMVAEIAAMSAPSEFKAQDSVAPRQAAGPGIEPPPNAPAAARAAPASRSSHRSILSIGLAVLLVGSLIAVAVLSLRSAQTTCGPMSTRCFDSGWQPVSNKTTTAYFFRHKLGIAPRTLSIWFSPTATGETAFPLLWKFQRNEAGNPVSIEARADLILLNIWNGVPLFGSYDASTDRWTTYTDGYYRVVAEQ
ncbi:hypothetical protein ASF22_22535 [Methylobacterium sp. Leaf87]|uniref:hypothetical protein n=1 Tax=Methylobacterium sp. Leaf87 TaxID=1736243 RepID=UPI0006F4188F|nr:hypothetical protein [Methylobacterium sp. Leaf87]KQO59035.1 hypothetical protein ASF22_22535 [Methylobacterium sp. Leaf87]